MKRILTILCLLAGCAFIAGAQTVTLKDWKLRKAGSCKAFKAEVPATVAGVLADAGRFGKDPLVSRNYLSIDKTQFDSPWSFTTRFKASPKAGRHFTLTFDSINYRADIFLNGKQIASADTTFGVFIKRVYDVTGLLRRSGRNRLKVVVQRAQPGDLNHGYVDWNPRPVDESMGILGAVTLTETGAVRIDDTFVRPFLNTATLAEADLRVEATLTNLGAEPVTGNLSIAYEGGEAEIPVTLQPGANTLSFGPEDLPMLHVDNPRVWWTWDLGTPELYHLDIAVKTPGGAGGDAPAVMPDSRHARPRPGISDRASLTFGIRSIERTLTGPGQNRTQFILNGRPILIKGAGWAADIFMRDTPESDALQASLVKDMNLNCIRFENIWGKDDSIYDECDRQGLLAMVGFSCQWEWEQYCGLPELKGLGCINDPASEDLAVAYFHDQVLRLRNHPSIICWLTGSDCIPNERLEQRYMEIYGKFEYRPYICSASGMKSKFGGPSGMIMAGPYEYVGPEYWYLDTSAGGAFGFNTETGVGLNMPQLPSLERMMAKDSLWPLSADWDYHCTTSITDMNTTRVMTEVMDATFGHAETLEDYVDRGHALDYDATRAMFEAFRCNFPGSTGIVQWMLNSAWPSLYWQLYDYWFVPTSAYYATRKACEPLQLVYNYKDNAVYGLNETGADARVRACIKMYDADSNRISEVCREVVLTDNAPVKVADLPARTEPVFLSLALNVTPGSGLTPGSGVTPGSTGGPLTTNFYALPARGNVHDWSRYNWYMTPISEYADMSFVTSLPATELDMEVTREGDVFTVTLTNPGNVVSFQNILRCTRPDGTLVAPAFWSDNFISLLPGESRTVTCRVPSSSFPAKTGNLTPGSGVTPSSGVTPGSTGDLSRSVTPSSGITPGSTGGPLTPVTISLHGWNSTIKK